MTPAEIALVKDSFRKVLPLADQAAALFYARLFELDPSLRARFRGDMAEQGRELMTLIATAVKSLERPDTVQPALRQLAARQAGDGATEEHYAVVGVALLWTLEKVLGADFTADVRQAWTHAYLFFANTLLDAQRDVRLAA